MTSIQPIFKEYIQFLKDHNIDLPIEEGKYWLDNGIVKAFSKGEFLGDDICYLYKITIDDNLNVSCKEHRDFKKNSKKTFETWDETIKRHWYDINQ